MAPHLALIDYHIRRLVKREIQERVMVVRMPPRHGKSELISHHTPAWFLRRFPHWNVLLATYEATFAASWGRKARDTYAMAAERYPLPRGLSSDQTAANHWATTGGGYMATAGVGGPFTGKGFHLGLCDDLIKNSEEAQSETLREKTWEWFTSTFWTRREPEGVLLVIGTPWHRDDYLARLRAWEEPIFEIELPAICERRNDILGRRIGDALWPDRYDEEELEKISRAQGPYYWSALYQQRPAQHDQVEWPEWYFGRHIWTTDFPDAFEHRVIAVDWSRGTNKKADFSCNCFIGWSGGRYWVNAQVRHRSGEQLCADIIEQHQRWGSELIYVEGNGAQELLRSMLRDRFRQYNLPAPAIVAVDSRENKLDRIRRIGPHFESKHIKVLDTPDNRRLIDQCRDFPLGDHDDGPDTLEMAIRTINEVARVKSNQLQLQEA